ncbi:MAG: prepilin-type N-terminal cleavage/methylation domain-containing protein [bacterium]|nr:prepilin-type N-terminal cleavage/methylation domain-containing protein [bacterium]
MLRSCRNAAFTLIELLIVVAIIGILAAIAVPNFLNAQTRAKLAASYGSMKTIQTAIGAYQVDYNSTPIDMGPDAETGVTYIALTTPTPYLSTIDPFLDEFKSMNEEDTGRWYAYGAPYHIDQLDNADRVNLFRKAGVGYFLFGWGPDRKPNWPWAILGETLLRLKSPNTAGPNQDGGIFYSTTNGLTSSGDIISTDFRIFQ